MVRWQDHALWKDLKERVPASQQPGWLRSPAPLAEASQKLLASMEAIAVIEHRRATGKVEVPDIFRLPNTIKRKGGITPQQRRQVRGPVGQAPRG